MQSLNHLGRPKTGSTKLQHALHSARLELAQHGVCYPDTKDPQEFCKVLGKFTGETPGFVVYIRRPSSDYVSSCQQDLSWRAALRPLWPRNALAILNAHRAYFPHATHEVRVFDRARLRDGDIVSDFADLFPSVCKALPLDTSETANDNASPSAMGMEFLPSLFLTHDDNRVRRTNKALRDTIRHLEEIEKKEDKRRIALVRPVADYLDYGSDVALRLRDACGVEFPGFDYERLERGDYTPPPNKAVDVRDIVKVDGARLKGLEARIDDALKPKKNTPSAGTPEKNKPAADKPNENQRSSRWFARLARRD